MEMDELEKMGMPTPADSEGEQDLTPINWRSCFYALLLGVMHGSNGMAMHTSQDLSAWVQSVRDHGDSRVAREMAELINAHRPAWVHRLMG